MHFLKFSIKSFFLTIIHYIRITLTLWITFVTSRHNRIDLLYFDGHGKTPPTNECPGYDTKQSDGKGSGYGALGNVKYPFIALTPRSTLSRSGST